MAAFFAIAPTQALHGTVAPAAALAGSHAQQAPFGAQVAAGTPPTLPEMSEPPRVSADAFVLMDGKSGRILYERNADQRRHPASTTKIMTGILALELGDADDIVATSRHASGTPGSSAHIVTGDRYRLLDLVRALLMKSGNDAAVALAEHAAGSVSGFADLMNDEARLLGLHDTHFVNPHGLTAPGHYTSAKDLALLARYALTIPEFSEIVSTRESTLPGLNARDERIVRGLRNTNRLLTYGWVTGVKTGTTNAAGDCLVASATKDGGELIAVVLHSNNRWSDALRLLEWGYDHFAFRTVATAGRFVGNVPVAGGVRQSVAAVVAADANVALPHAEADAMRVVSHLRTSIAAPVAAGERLGTLDVTANGAVVLSVPIVARTAVGQGRWWDLLRAIP